MKEGLPTWFLAALLTGASLFTFSLPLTLWLFIGWVNRKWPDEPRTWNDRAERNDRHGL